MRMLSPAEVAIRHPDLPSPDRPLGVAGHVVALADVERAADLAQFDKLADATSYWLSDWSPTSVGRLFTDPQLGSFAVVDTFNPDFGDYPDCDHPGGSDGNGDVEYRIRNGHDDPALVAVHGDVVSVEWTSNGHRVRAFGDRHTFTTTQAETLAAHYR